ncbi:hypothetical protein C8R43DRAFT_1244174 [Mycena crocata]|nr:hypothetical protein C8R43DRAFT_1244174 [Mycena crocata]
MLGGHPSKLAVPRLPPEIIAIVIENLRSSRHNILACSLVCRGWLAFSRNHLDRCIGGDSAAAFLELIAAPAATLAATLRTLRLLRHDTPIRWGVLSMLEKFSSLRSLESYDGTTTFASYSGLVAFMAQLPSLQVLDFGNVLWAIGPGQRPPILDIMLAIHRITTVDFSSNDRIETLNVHDALRINILADEHDVARLVLKVQTDSLSNPPRGVPLAQFADLLETAHFTSVRTIIFIVDGDIFAFEGLARPSRELFEPVLRAAIPSRPGREVVCLDGEDAEPW